MKNPRRYWNGHKNEALDWIKANVGHQGSDCLLWTWHCHPVTGYGAVGFKGKVYKAHRIMCEFAHGPAPSDEHHAAHACGNRSCVNPKHLSWKTPSANQLDRRIHGTTGAGRKLRVEQWAEIRALKGKKTQAEIAAIYGVSFQNISHLHRKM